MIYIQYTSDISPRIFSVFLTNAFFSLFGNSLDKLRHTRSVAYSAELVLLNKHQIGRPVAELIQTITVYF